MRKITVLTIGLIAVVQLMGQKSTLKLSIDQAVEYALENNKTYLNAKRDVDLSKLSIWETASIGLPQVNGTASLNDNLKLMTNLLPAIIFNPAAGPDDYIEVQFGTKYNTSASLTVSQMLFNGSYWVGIQSLKIIKLISEQGLEKAKLEIGEGIHNAYYLVLITESTKRVLEGNLENLKETFAKTKTMYEAGLAESTDVDQLSVSLSMMENTIKSMERAIEMNYNLLRFQLGVDFDQQIELTQSLDDIIKVIDFQTTMVKPFDVNANIDFQMMNSQLALAEKTVLREKAEVLPSLSAFYNFQHSGMGNELKDLSWFPSSMIGVQLNVPIFASGKRHVKIQKAKIELEKAKSTKEIVQEQLLMQENQLRLNLKTAFEKFESNKNSLEVSKRVYDSIKRKYEQGIVSSLDLTQANDNYLKSESSYLSSMMELLQAKTALDKLSNSL